MHKGEIMSSASLNAIIWLAFIFLTTTLGSGLTFVFSDKFTAKIFSVLSGFSVGVMIAASVWSLIIPAIDNSAFTGAMRIFETAVGFFAGGAFMVITALVFPESAEKTW